MMKTHSQTVDLFQEDVQQIPYVSTDLKILNHTISNSQNRDIVHAGTSFRRLDADYFIWISQAVDKIEKAYSQNRIPQKAYAGMIAQYRIIKKWIEDNVSKKDLNAAQRRSTLAEYAPPQSVKIEKPKAESPKATLQEPFLYPVGGHWEHTVPIDPEVVKIIDAIRDEALSKNWAEASLYQNRGHFIAGKWYGLICMLDKTDKIIKIDSQYIHIRTFKGSMIPPEGMMVKFENPNYGNQNGEQK